MTQHEFLNTYLPAIIVFAIFVGFRYLRVRKVKAALPEYRKRGAVFVDVRTKGEFNNSHHPDTINIPLDQLGNSLDKIDKSRPVVVCCASGARSERAREMLDSFGYEAFNAGSWLNL